MAIPGRLGLTTLGDVLGELHRCEASGHLELTEGSGSGSRVHRIELKDGKISHIESPLGRKLGALLALPYTPPDSSVPLGERLLREGKITAGQLTAALQAQRRERLEMLFTLSDAALRFRVRRLPLETEVSPPPLQKSDFLTNRPRSRDRDGSAAVPVRRPHLDDLRVLGLAPGAGSDAIRQAFRSVAHALHPDRNPHASPQERAELLVRFAEASRAYHRLIA